MVTRFVLHERTVWKHLRVGKNTLAHSYQPGFVLVHAIYLTLATYGHNLD